MSTYTLLDLFSNDENAFQVLEDMKMVVSSFLEDNDIDLPSEISLDVATTQIVLAVMGVLELEGKLKHIDDLLEHRPYTPSISTFRSELEALYNSLDDDDDVDM